MGLVGLKRARALSIEFCRARLPRILVRRPVDALAAAAAAHYPRRPAPTTRTPRITPERIARLEPDTDTVTWARTPAIHIRTQARHIVERPHRSRTPALTLLHC